jgi:ribosomal protein S12 methylthiotransferase accessory factor
MDLSYVGMCHDRLGQSARAVHFLETAVRLDPGLDFARRRLEELLG